MMSRVERVQQRAFVRYLVVGGAAFVVEYSSFYVLFSVFNWAVWLANGVSFLLALLTSFACNRAWTFGAKTYSKRTTQQLGLYITLAFINLLLTLGLVQIMVSLGASAKLAKFTAMLITSAWNFLIYKFLIFTHKQSVN